MTERDAIEFLSERGFKVTRQRTSARSRRHRDCADHVRVDGFREAVCILAGQQRADVIGFAVEVAAIAREARLPSFARAA